tara:strand:- start:1294 stop:2064 length:771 start_codon:yes stop_codon:yes gene_type:complete
MIEMKERDLFEDIELQTPMNTDTTVKDVIMEEGAPSITSPEWNDYILELFADNELFDGRPTCAGLRRVSELVLGQIVSSKPTQVFPPSSGDEVGRATVIWEVVFADGSVFSDVADSWEGNTDDMFCVFNTATAATRAEGRALRKALRLRTVAAEEMTKKDTASIVKSISQTKRVETEGEYDDSYRMSDAQANFIDSKCKQLNLNVAEFFNEVFDLNVKRKIDKRQASDAIKKLNDYQQDKSLIPDSITAYLAEWRN